MQESSTSHPKQGEQAPYGVLTAPEAGLSGPPEAGLVISAKTRLIEIPDTVPADIGLPPLVFPSSDLIEAAAGFFPEVDPDMAARYESPWAMEISDRDFNDEREKWAENAWGPTGRSGNLDRWASTEVGRYTREGARGRVEISAGVVRFTRVDLAARERRDMRASDLRARGPQIYADCECGRCPVVLAPDGREHWSEPGLAAECPGKRDDEDVPMAFSEREPDRDSTRNLVTSWSRKSRANLRYRILTLDLAKFVSTGTPCMVTLTLPGDWLSVAPDAATASKCFDRFTRAWAQKWGPLQCLWKREFQDRGAPHWHLWLVPPVPIHRMREFREWLSRAWTTALQVKDPAERARSLKAGTGVDFAEGMRASDPHRLATYFLKESGSAESKSYQNSSPAEWAGQSVGRFWGVRGLEPLVVTVDVDPRDEERIWRVMRKVSERQFPRRTIARAYPVAEWKVVGPWNPAEGDGGLVAVGAYRKRRPVARRFKVRGSAGWVGVNNGAAFGADIGRYASELARARQEALTGSEISQTFLERIEQFKAEKRARAAIRR